MKKMEYALLQLNKGKELGLYSIINKVNLYNLLYIASYLLLEYFKRDFACFVDNLKIIDEEKGDDEVIMHGNKESIFLDLKNYNVFYIASLFDYLDFNTTNLSFVEELKLNKFKHAKIDRHNFLELLQDWNNILDTKPPYVILYQDEHDWTGLKSFDSQEEMEQFIQDFKQIVH